MGPVLFTVFVDDLPDGVQSSYEIFADDTMIYDKASNSRHMQEDIVVRPSGSMKTMNIANRLMTGFDVS